jgi:hypothetical protein
LFCEKSTEDDEQQQINTPHHLKAEKQKGPTYWFPNQAFSEINDIIIILAFENDDVSAAYTADKKNHVDFLESLGKSLEKCEVEDLNRYLWAMFVMTSSVANATGGGWFSSQKISDEEAQVAVGIFLLLGQGQSIETLKVWIEKNGI